MDDPPFALDFDRSDLNTSRSSLSSGSYDSNFDSTTGYRVGGPKESRLRRVALLSPQKDTEGLHAIKVENLSRSTSQEKLEAQFKVYGEVGDVYIPKKLSTGTLEPAKDFAVIRFKDEEAARKALEKADRETLDMDGSPVKLSPMKKQNTLFSKGTGYLGICNEPYDDGTRTVKKWDNSQEIALESCRARNGYPWGRKRELKFLPLHASTEALEMFPVKVINLDPTTRFAFYCFELTPILSLHRSQWQLFE